MKILMLTPYVPYPPSSGGQIRTLYLLKYLSFKHEITLVSLYKNEKEKQYYEDLKPFCKNIYFCKRPKNPWQLNNIFKAIFSVTPFLIIRNYSNEARSVIKKLLLENSYDVIHAETFYIMPHIPKTNIPILLVEQTIEYKVYQHFINSLPIYIRFFLNFDIVKLRNREQYYWRKANLVAAVSESDENIIKKLEPDIKTTIIPNGAGDDMIVKSLTQKNLNEPILLFQGNFYWLQNVEAAKFLVEKIYPNLKKLLSKVKIIISGQNAKRISVVKNHNLEILDILPDDVNMVKTLYHKATIFLSPIYGPGGTRLKILAAMASGIPVISTKIGLEGLDIENNKHAIIANNSQEFINSINKILTNRELYERIRKNAYELVKKKYSWQKISQKLETVYKNIKIL